MTNGRILLVTLNASQRASRLWCSRILKILLSAVSNSQNDGPARLNTPAFPKVPRAGVANAAGFRYWRRELPYRFGRTWFGSSKENADCPFSSLSMPVFRFKACPVRNGSMTDSRQSLARRPRNDEAEKWGDCATAVRLKICRMSHTQ